MLDICTRELKTPKGIRSLSPKSQGYTPYYVGRQEDRDRAYHQGTAWPWLTGFYLEAYLRVYRMSGVNYIERQLIGFEEELFYHCVGTIPELFDGNPPLLRPRRHLLRHEREQHSPRFPPTREAPPRRRSRRTRLIPSPLPPLYPIYSPMKVLMFGWEFPPHILGGLGTASYGMTAGLAAQPDMDITFCIPKPWGDEDKSFMNIIGLSQTPIVWRDVDYDYVRERLGDRMTPEQYYALRDHIYADFSYRLTDDLGCIEFSGRYPDNLQEEINNYSIVAGVIARQQDYDIIHAHDWLTYPAGIHAKQVSGKPLVVHVHATDFDRSRGNVNPTVYAIERDGMDHADCIMCVSELTRRTVIDTTGKIRRKWWRCTTPSTRCPTTSAGSWHNVAPPPSARRRS